MAIESLNKAPSSFIQFKAIEILFHLHKINHQMFSIIEIDFDQYIQKLNENNLRKLKQKICPKCRVNFENNDIRYLPQNTIYKNLYSSFFEAGHILPSIELENSDQIMNNQDVKLILY